MGSGHCRLLAVLNPGVALAAAGSWACCCRCRPSCPSWRSVAAGRLLAVRVRSGCGSLAVGLAESVGHDDRVAAARPGRSVGGPGGSWTWTWRRRPAFRAQKSWPAAGTAAAGWEEKVCAAAMLPPGIYYRGRPAATRLTYCLVTADGDPAVLVGPVVFSVPVVSAVGVLPTVQLSCVFCAPSPHALPQDRDRAIQHHRSC